jgi:AGZA family xanthine/uracil permease-like MFS transporter
LIWFLPLEATLGILLWIGLIITAQAFQEVPKAHAPAVAIGFIPSLAAWGVLLVQTALEKAAPGYTLQQASAQFSPELYFNGMLSLAQGFMLISIFFSAIMVKVIERKWDVAAVWCLIAAVASACGIIHGFVFTPDGGYAASLFQWTGFGRPIPSGLDFAVAYVLAAVVLLGMEALKPGEIEP